MTTGALIFAQNNGVVDYVKLAVFAAERIKKYLDIPVALATDSEGWLESAYPNHKFDNVIHIEGASAGRRAFHDGTLASKILEWKNLSRTKIYDITPFDTTLVIDSDYIINSSLLKPALEKDVDFQIYKSSTDLTTWRQNLEFKRINDQSIPFYWATVFIFKKTAWTHALFTLVDYIRENWVYFRALYNIDSSIYRNDYSFSIAIHLLNDKITSDLPLELPGKMMFTTDKDILLEMKDNAMKFLIEKENHLGEYTAAKTRGLDIHVMNKISLARCIDEVENV
jgi:hypothetical protein